MKKLLVLALGLASGFAWSANPYKVYYGDFDGDGCDDQDRYGFGGTGREFDGIRVHRPQKRFYMWRGVVLVFLSMLACRPALALSSDECHELFDVLESYAQPPARVREINAVVVPSCEDLYSLHCEMALDAVGEKNALMLHRVSLWESGGDISEFSRLVDAVDDISAYNLSGAVAYVGAYMFASAQERSVLARKLESQGSYYIPKRILLGLSECVAPILKVRPADR